MQAVAIKQEAFELLPESIKQALMASMEAIEALDHRVIEISNEIADLNEKIKIAIRMQMPTRSLKIGRTKRSTELEEIGRMKTAYQHGYLEIPNLDREARTLSMNNTDNPWRFFVLDAKVPLRVFQAVEKARDLVGWDNIHVYDQRAAGDPIIGGRIGNRYFFITSWR